jgi:phage tail-like protein
MSQRLSNTAGKRVDPFRAFNFLVEVEGLVLGGFMECSGLQVETEIQEYAEGGLNDYTHHFRGRTKYSPLTLKRGITLDDQLWRWHQSVLQGSFVRKNGTIYLLDEKHTAVVWWNFLKAFPSKWTGPEMRASSGEVAVESLELIHQGLRLSSSRRE